MPDDSALSRREKELFSNTYQEEEESRKIKLSSRVAELPHSWGNDSKVVMSSPQEKRSLGTLFFVVSFFILIATAGFTGWKFLSHKNEVSSANIAIDLNIKQSVEGGETVPLSYSIQNNNTLPLLNASLLITYDKGVGAQDEQNKVHEKIDLGTIANNEVRKGDVQVQLYGAENTSRLIEAKLVYNVGGSNSSFDKTVTVSPILRTPPVSIHVDAPNKTSPDQDIAITVSLKNNVATTTQATLVQLTLPQTFTVASSDPGPSNKGTVWQYTSLNPGEEKQITLHGSLKGVPGETVSIKALVGSVGAQGLDIGNVYSFDTKEITLANPGITVKVSSVHSDGGNVTASLLPGERATVNIAYTNASDSTLSNTNIVASIGGTPIDQHSVTVDTGLYDSVNNTIIWNGGSTDQLKSLAPGAQGTLMFTFVVPTSKDASGAITVGASAQADTETGDEHFVSKDEKRWFIEGGATVSEGVRYAGTVFTNTGPLPPVANQTTTYTITLQASAQNGFQKGKVTFSLPLYVTWLNQVSGGTATYDSRSRVVTWNLGDVPQNQTAKISMRVGVKPSLTHVGTIPQITSGITFDGVDMSSQGSLKRVLGALTTRVDDTSTKDISTVVNK